MINFFLQLSKNTSYSNAIYKYNTETGGCECIIQLPILHKKISFVEANNAIYVGGEPMESQEEIYPPFIFKYDLSSGEMASVSNGLPKIGTFTLGVAKQRFLFVIPVALHNAKIYYADLQSPLPQEEASEEFSEEKKQLEEMFKWEAVTLKNPKNLNSQLLAPAWVMEISEDVLMVNTNKGSLLFNWKEELITDFAQHRQRDEFYDGVYHIDENVFAFGKLGVHSYSIATGKWSFFPQQLKL